MVQTLTSTENSPNPSIMPIQSNPRSNLPLTGIKVIEFSTEISASMVTMMLADLGATVIHVYRADFAIEDKPHHATLDRNKFCIGLNLKQPHDLQRALTLIANADIVVENFRPGVLKKLGIDFKKLHEQYPATLFLSMPGFASTDTEHAHWKATEAVVAASSGVYTDMGLNRVLMGVNPSFSPLPLASAYGSVMAMFGLMTALYHRQKTGRGDWIESPLAASLMETLSYNSSKVENYPERYKTQRESEIERRRANNIPMDMTYEEVHDLLDPFFRTYICQDGRPFYVVCMAHRNHTRRCLETLGIYDELVAMGLPDTDDVFKPVKDWGAEASIKAYPLPKKWSDIIAGKMKEVFLTKTSDEWETIFGEGQFPGAKHRTLWEWMNDEHAHETGLIIKTSDVSYGEMLQPGPVFWSEDIAETMIQPNSRLFVEYEQALALVSAPSVLSTPVTNPLPNEEKKQDLWLDGVKVLDLTNVIAGPHSVMCLTRFGADVIKLDPVKPKFDPWCSVVYAVNQGRGKKSILMDKDTKKGREIFEKMVRDVDIVVINAPERQLEPLGLDEKTLKKINAKVIFCRLDCFGGPKLGPRSNYLGYDDLVQATTGIKARFGGSIFTPEEHAHVGTIDVVCGFAASASMAMALFSREKNGDYKRVRTSLSALSGLIQVKYCYDHAGRWGFYEPSGPDAKGYSYLSRFYQTGDNWIYLDALPHHVEKLETLFPGLMATIDKETFLANCFADKSAHEWVEYLQNEGIAASTTQNIMHLRKRFTRENDHTSGVEQASYAFTRFADHPSGHPFTIVDPYAIRPSNGRVQYVEPAEKFGASTIAILKRYGYSDSDIDALLADGVVSLSWGDEYIPS